MQVCEDPALVPPAGGAWPPFSESNFSLTTQVVTLQYFRQIKCSHGCPRWRGKPWCTSSCTRMFSWRPAVWHQTVVDRLKSCQGHGLMCTVWTCEQGQQSDSHRSESLIRINSTTMSTWTSLILCTSTLSATVFGELVVHSAPSGSVPSPQSLSSLSEMDTRGEPQEPFLWALGLPVLTH